MTQALWFTSRSCGQVSLLMLTLVAVLGALHTGRAATRRWSRFAVHTLHRNLAVLAVAFVAIHVAAAIIDPYAGIRWVDAVLPFASTYQPLWTGLGATSADLLLAVVVTSAVRVRLPRKLWRGLHFAAYVLWPIALVHGLGIRGADGDRGWVQAVDAGCALAVVAAAILRTRARHPDSEARRAEVGLR